MAVPARKKPAARRRNSGGRFILLIVIPLLTAGGAYWLWQHEQARPRKHAHARHTLAAAQKTSSPVPQPAPAPIPVPPPTPTPAGNVEDLSVPQRAGGILPQVQTPPPGNAETLTRPLPEFPRPARNPLEIQIALARRVISPGSIDGAMGHQSRAALAAFQRAQNLAESGLPDTNTRALLTLGAPAFTTYTVTSNDLASLQPIGVTWLEKSQQSTLAYETELELIGEMAHANPLLIKKLNPDTGWPDPPSGTAVTIPEVTYPDPADKAALVVIHLGQRYLEAFDAGTNLLAHFPCSIAAKVEKRPIGELHVIVIAPHPNYTVNPELFPESAELQAIGRKLILPPGPNNPVGVAWIGLDRPGYGMHGTPIPEQVGRTESHGCFRLANWDAEYLVKLAWIGMPVLVEP